jgi:glycosyltransferase involved in cell wall biosynthesis
MSLLSVIIPTRRRPAILQRALERLANQTIAKELEIVVVHDGMDDADTRSMIETSCPLPCTYFAIPKAQQGTARNRGVQRASADRILFIGDDIFLEHNACEMHVRGYETRAMSCEEHPLKTQDSKLKAHRAKLVALLGFTTWDPAVGITSVMRWLEATGWQFGYGNIRRYAHCTLPKSIQHQFTYTSHLSLPTSVARHTPFREDITLYGWEDIEWGMRLREVGIPLVYEPDAKALHHHHVELQDSLERMHTVGRSLHTVAKFSPAFDRVPKGWKRIAYELLAYVPTLRGKHAAALLQGLKEQVV